MSDATQGAGAMGVADTPYTDCGGGGLCSSIGQMCDACMDAADDGVQLMTRGVRESQRRAASEAALARMRRLGLLCAICDRDRTEHHDFGLLNVDTCNRCMDGDHGECDSLGFVCQCARSDHFGRRR